jgi:hypothetical protein
MNEQTRQIDKERVVTKVCLVLVCLNLLSFSLLIRGPTRPPPPRL